MWVKREIVLIETSLAFQRTKNRFCLLFIFSKGAYHVQPRPLIFNPPPPPQFQSVWSNPSTETYMQPPTMINPITQYVQVRIAYIPVPSSISVFLPSEHISIISQISANIVALRILWVMGNLLFLYLFLNPCIFLYTKMKSASV
jgi:hypothetical protein